VAADWDSSGSDAGADTIRFSETSATTYDIDPDAANYAAGNDPDTAYRNQGGTDSPNGWGSHAGLDDHQENDGYADGADEHDQPREERYDNDTPDLWGDTDPDSALYADLDAKGTGSPDGRQDSDREDRPEANPDADQSSLEQYAEENAEQTASPEQQRISALETENASAQQRIADADQKIAELEAKNDEQAARLDRIEQFIADSKKNPADSSAADHGGDKIAASSDHQTAQDTAISEHKASGETRDARDADNTRWRRITSAENVGVASTVLGAADTVAQFAMHATPEGIVGLGAMVLGVTAVGLAKLEKKRKDNKA
jgi:hypothetical protein